MLIKAFGLIFFRSTCYRITLHEWRNFAFMGVLTNKYKYYNTKPFSKLIRLTFEQIEIFAPADYEDALNTFYGKNWRTPIFTHTHSAIYSADISYKEFFSNVKYI